MDQPEAGRGGMGGGLDAVVVQGSEVEELVSGQPEVGLGGTSHPESAVVEENALGVSPQ